MLYQTLILSPFGLNRENASALWLLILLAAITFLGLNHFGGDIPIVLSILYLIGIMILSVMRLDFSLYLLLAGILVNDQYAIPGFTPITRELHFFSNLKENTYLPFFEAGVVNPVEIHLVFICFSLLIWLAVKRDFHLRAIPVWMPYILFLGSLVFAFLYGMRGGGDFLIALWEIRALLYLCLMYLIVPQIIQTREQIMVVMWIAIFGIAIKAFQGVARFVDLGFTTGGFAVLTNHEDPVFMVLLFILLIGFLVFNVKHPQRYWMLLLLLPLIFGFYTGMRRASYASFMVCIAAVVVLLPVAKRWTFAKYALPILGVILVYSAVFWNSSGALARPVQMIKSGFETPNKETNFRDYSSNLYREYENYNLARTVANNPLIGIGFGKRYEQPIPLVNIRFTLRDYIPHNQILWVLIKMGGLGFLAFWLFFNSFAAKSAMVFTKLQDPYLKAVALVVAVAVINQLVVSYFDLQLTYYRNMLFLGVLMGLLPALEAIATTESSESK